MFRKDDKIYTDLLALEKDARQIRTRKNTVFASNELGQSLFGTGENPFVFLKTATDTNTLQKLVDAYCSFSPMETQITTQDGIYQITLKRINNMMMLCAVDKSPEFAIHKSLSRQLGFMSDMLSSFPYPLYLTDKKGEIVYANKAFCGITGATVQEILGLPLSDFILENCPECAGTSDTISLLKTADGTTSFRVIQHPFETDIDLFFCGTLQKYMPEVVATDINLFRISPIPAVIIDSFEHHILQANLSFTNMLKQIEGALDHQHISAILGDASKETLKTRLEKLLNGTAKNERIELTTAPDFGGRTFNTFIGWANNDKESFILYFVDASERKNLEEQFAHAQKMQAMGQMAGGVAHDFNNLLTAIIGFCDLLLGRHTSSDADFMDLMQIKGNAKKASELVGQLLTFSRKQPSKIKTISLHDAFVDLTALLQRSVAPFVTLKTEFKRNLGSVKIDPNQLMQIFLNLAVNSKDAMPTGGTFKISAGKEKIKKTKPCGTDLLTPGDYVKIMVSDTGTGISQEHLAHIFEPFFTTKENKNGSGTGLGLSTVYGIVRGAGGFISVDSEKGVGTTFTIYLPRFEDKPEDTGGITPALRPMITEPSNKHILLVDDEDGVRMVAARALKTQGWTVTECANAEQAIEQLQTETDFDLLLSDMIMPGMDGETLIKQAKLARSALKSILMSGYSEEFARHGSEQNDDFQFLAKPFELADLIKKVKEVLETE